MRVIVIIGYIILCIHLLLESLEYTLIFWLNISSENYYFDFLSENISFHFSIVLLLFIPFVWIPVLVYIKFKKRSLRGLLNKYSDCLIALSISSLFTLIVYNIYIWYLAGLFTYLYIKKYFKSNDL
jgi:hypothetical protein